VWPPGRPSIIRVGSTVRTEAYEAWKPIDEQMSHDERVRLLYVACTRAQDHLIVSLHRKTRKAPPASEAKHTSAELLAATLGDRLAALPVLAAPQGAAAGDIPVDVAPAGDESGGPTTGRPADEPGASEPGALQTAGDRSADEPADDDLPSFDEWRRQRDEALSGSRRPRTVAATALTEDGRPDAVADPGLHKRPRDLDLPAWQKGRYGSAIGRAVHGVLQTVDLDGGPGGGGVDDAVAAQAAAEGVIGHEPRIGALVDAALRSPTVAEAAASPHWREVYVGVPLGDDRTLEGYIDLLYRRQDGLVVVDYKTGPAGLDTDLAPLVARYRLQGASYALAVADATGEPVRDVVFVFLTPEGPVDRRLPALDEAVAETRRLASSGDDRLIVT
jgi:ATP-dependent exoDNAse (exonuclease V) beta subunit